MKGQWIGNYTGTNSGHIIIDIDEFENHYEGAAFLFDHDVNLPNTFARLKTSNKDNAGAFIVSLLEVIHPTKHDRVLSSLEVSQEFPDVTMPAHASATYRWNVNNNTLSLSWHTNIGTNSTAVLFASRARETSEYQAIETVNTWEAFKNFASNLELDRYIFRGQWQSKRLRTSFHRTDRSNVVRFLNEDLPALHRHLTAKTKHFYNLRDPWESGAFWSLIQHHGYPTPLLDWTKSPFIAAYFAYRHKEDSEAGNIRIFIFNQKKWRENFQQVENAWCAFPHLSIIETYALGNERAIPQQALSTLTNIDDIESYIRSKETDENKYLRVVDLPRGERIKALQELSMMGITEGSLFPGLEGMCKELRARFFGF